MLQKIIHNDKLLAIIIKNNYKSKGIEFFTPDDFSQQLGYMNREKGTIIPPHTHNKIERTVHYTHEVLIMKKGKVRLDVFEDDRTYLESRVLETGDIVLLAYGGHGLEILEDSEIIEVKQGPYTSDMDKVRFDSIDIKNIIIRGDNDPSK